MPQFKGHEVGKCEVCAKSLRGRRLGTKYCCVSHQQWAYKNRKRVAKKALSYLVDPDATADLHFLETISKPAADCVKMIASVAGRDIANDVLGGMWDILVKLDVFEHRVPLRNAELVRRGVAQNVSMD